MHTCVETDQNLTLESVQVENVKLSSVVLISHVTHR